MNHDAQAYSFEIKLKIAKVRFTQKMLMKWSKCHSCEPFFVPELGGKFKLMNGSVKILISSFFCISKINQ